MKAKKTLAVLAVIAVVLFGMAMPLAAHDHDNDPDQIIMGDGALNAHLNGNISPILTLLIPNCTNGTCYFANGPASATGHLQSSGSYIVSSPSASPFYLTHQADDSFTVTQTADINFTYTAQAGTLTGKLYFSSVSASQNLHSTMVGTMTSAHGSFARYFPDGAKVTIMLGLTFPLQILYTVNGFSAVEFQDGNMMKAAHHCGGHDHGYWKYHGRDWQHGRGMWVGRNHYSDSEVMGLLQQSEDNDASMVLVHRLIAALLNIDNNLKRDPVQTVIDDANTLLGSDRLPQRTNLNSAAGQQMLDDAMVLDSYNNNNITTADSR